MAVLKHLNPRVLKFIFHEGSSTGKCYPFENFLYSGTFVFSVPYQGFVFPIFKGTDASEPLSIIELQTVGTEACNTISDSRASLPEWQPLCTFPNMQEITPGLLTILLSPFRRPLSSLEGERSVEVAFLTASPSQWLWGMVYSPEEEFSISSSSANLS